MTSEMSGEQLDASEKAALQRACSGCHPVPPADILPKRLWKAEVRKMAHLRIGVTKFEKNTPIPEDLVPVLDYLQRHAPVKLPLPAPWPALSEDPLRFDKRGLRLDGLHFPPAIANVKIVHMKASGKPELILSDVRNGLVLRGQPDHPEQPLEVLGHVPHPCHTEVVDLDGDGILDLLVTDLGEPFPSDAMHGGVWWLRGRADGKFDTINLVQGLPRTADSRAVDLDGDGKLDLLVGSFGWLKTGGIYAFKNETTSWDKPRFTQIVIDSRVGTINTVPTHLNGDTGGGSGSGKNDRPDFIAVMAQHNEAVVAFRNQGNFRFTPRTLYAGPHPNWGSTGIDLVDLDGDGLQDVLLTHGDTLDDSLVKPYHGIQWIRQKAPNAATPKTNEAINEPAYETIDLAPLAGAHRARAADLDGDGRLDVVVSTFLPQLRDSDPYPNVGLPPLPSVVWLAQTAPGVFTRHTIEIGACDHATLDVGDLDGDGRPDIVVGNLFSVPGAGLGDPQVLIYFNRGPNR